MRIRTAISIVSALLLAAPALAVDAKSATHLSSYTWREKAIWFGGFSALELSEDGQSMTVLSDRASILTATITRDGDRITDVTAGKAYSVRSSRNRILLGWAGDSEGLAIAPDGTIFISFEGVHRVARYPELGSPAKVLPRPKAFEGLARNGSFEGLAMDGLGRLYTLTESSRTIDEQIPVYMWNGQGWSTPFTLPPSEGFLPVSADFGPDGRFYVLERDASLLGFRSRLRRWEVTEGGVRAEETLFRTGTGTHDNLEGLSVWRDQQGRLRATMISDDNFLGLQRTELVEYLLPE
ncbi:MAG: esterase-like activity of phytase family protein [Ruegeria sp.]|uniref:esterase-like activity of phytase family protein n=1 Tax=Ruegeria sp. TaxID=1879320 RepID=UPI00349EAFF1